MSYTDLVICYIKAIVEIVPTIGPMLRCIKLEDYLPLTELFSNITKKIVSGDEILNTIVNYFSDLANNNIFICIRARIIAERLRLTTRKHSEKRMLFLELEHKFSKLRWRTNMNSNELYKFTVEFNKIYNLIEQSIKNISEQPNNLMDPASEEEIIKYRNIYGIYQTDVNVYKNLLIDLLFFTKSQYDNRDTNDINYISGYPIITDLLEKICLIDEL